MASIENECKAKVDEIIKSHEPMILKQIKTTSE